MERHELLVIAIERAIVEATRRDVLEARCTRRNGRNQLVNGQSDDRGVPIRELVDLQQATRELDGQLVRKRTQPAHAL
jgi:hypothetical protein